METQLTTQSRSWLPLIIVGGLFYLAGQLIAFHGQQATSPSANRELSVNGMGEIQAKPDIAQITLGVTTGTQPTAKEANDMLAKKFQAVVDAVKGMGIAEADVKTTSISITPMYDYVNGKQVARGFEASQQIEIKVRNIDSVGELIAKTTAEGVNQVGGVNLTMDKPENLQDQAEAKAIEDAKGKAKELAKQLGVHLGRVKYYSANNPGTGGPLPYAKSAEFSGAEDAQANPATPVPSGSQTIISNVIVTFEIR